MSPPLPPRLCRSKVVGDTGDTGDTRPPARLRWSGGYSLGVLNCQRSSYVRPGEPQGSPGQCNDLAPRDQTPSGPPDGVLTLHHAADKLVNLPDYATYLKHVSETSAGTISNSTTQLSVAVQRLESAIAAIPTPAQSAAPRPPAIPPTAITGPVRPEWYWKGMVAGWAGWAFFAFAMLIVWLNATGY